MANKKSKLTPKTILKLPDLEQSKSAVLNSLTSRSSQRSYDHAIREFIDWYCSEPRLAFNKTVVTRYPVRGRDLPTTEGAGSRISCVCVTRSWERASSTRQSALACCLGIYPQLTMKKVI